MDLIEKTPEFPLKGIVTGGVKVYDAHLDKQAEDFEIVKLRPHVWHIQGEKVEKTYALINITTDEGIAKLVKYLDKIGVDDRLYDMGAQDGDSVTVGEFEFIYTR